MIVKYIEHNSWNNLTNDYTGKPSGVIMYFYKHKKCNASAVFFIVNKDTYKNNKLENCFFSDNLEIYSNKINKEKIKSKIIDYMKKYNNKYNTNYNKIIIGRNGKIYEY